MDESAARLFAWAETLPDEARVALRYALAAARTAPSADTGTEAGEGLWGRAAARGAALVESPAVSPIEAVCDLGRRWVADDDWTWADFVFAEPHWYHRTTWRALRVIERRRGIGPEEGPGALCRQRYQDALRPLSAEEEARFGALEARRLGARELSRAERLELGVLGSRFAWTVRGDAARRARRDELVNEHSGIAPLTAPELATLTRLHRQAMYKNRLEARDTRTYRRLRFRFSRTDERALDDVLLAILGRRERRAHEATLRCIAQHNLVRRTLSPIADELARRSEHNEAYPETLADLGPLAGADRERFRIAVLPFGKVRVTPRRGSGVDPRAAWEVSDFHDIAWVGENAARCGDVFRAAGDPDEEVE